MYVFLGYPTDIKAYKLYDVHTKQIFFSRDIVFHDKIFPFFSVKLNEPHANPFSTLVLPSPHLSNSHIPPSPTMSPSTANSPSTPVPDSTTIPPINPQHNADPSILPTRISNWPTQPPSYLRDYHCNLLSHSPTHSKHTLYLLSQVLPYDTLSPDHKHFALTVSSQFEPRFYHEAVPFPEWHSAMQSELAAPESNKTWTVVPLPPGKHSVGCLSLYKIKCHSNRSV